MFDNGQFHGQNANDASALFQGFLDMRPTLPVGKLVKGAIAAVGSLSKLSHPGETVTEDSRRNAPGNAHYQDA